MKKSSYLVILLILVVLGASSCSTTKILPTNISDNAKNITSQENKALVYVYRISALGYAVGLRVDCNNKELVSFFPKRYYLCSLDPGKYVFTGHGENEDDLIVTLEPNKKYYVEVTPQMGWVKARCKLTLIGAPDGASKVMKCKLVGMNSAAKDLLNYKE